jgi:dTDP-D-glucose 4,6-dehydratase
LGDASIDNIAMTKFPFAHWKNMFESNNAIGDEIRYVFDRQKKDNRMGNTLERPSLLMKKLFTKTTSTNDEVLKKGTNYTEHDLQSREVAEAA